MLFQADGYLSLELWGSDSALAGSIAPEFFTRSGEVKELPARLLYAVMMATKGVTRVNCDRALFATAPAPAIAAERETAVPDMPLQVAVEQEP
jgi:hypothetical protein